MESPKLYIQTVAWAEGIKPWSKNARYWALISGNGIKRDPDPSIQNTPGHRKVKQGKSHYQWKNQNNKTGGNYKINSQTFRYAFTK